MGLKIIEFKSLKIGSFERGERGLILKNIKVFILPNGSYTKREKGSRVNVIIIVGAFQQQSRNLLVRRIEELDVDVDIATIIMNEVVPRTDCICGS